MLSLVSVLLLAQLLPSEQLIRPRVYRSDGADRVMRAGADDYAFFEFAPTSGAGMPAACSSTAPTGAKGEALTFSRGSGAVCTKTATGGLVTSGIADGDLVEMGSNVVRVEYASTGVRGARIESVSRQNINPRFIDFTNAAYSDVGTPTPTTGQTSPFAGTYANSAVRYDDNDAAAFEGRSITLTVSAGQPYVAHCYVKAGSLAKARIVLDGTAATITGLSSTTWSILEVADASASAASVTLEIDNGSVASDTGTVVWGGCQLEAGTYRTSIIATNGSPVTRQAETIYRDHGSLVQINSLAISYEMPSATLVTGAVTAVGVAGAADTIGTGGPPLAAIANGGQLKGYANGIGYTGTGSTSAVDRISVSIPTGGVTARWTLSSSTAAGTPTGTSRYFFLGAWNSTASNNGCPNCIVTRGCFGLGETECR